jgi:tetrapyrrole methylase family protein / MazG family protein
MTTAAVRVVGLGPSDLSAISQSAMEALRKARKVIVRTANHPAVAELSDCGILFESFDSLYETADSFSALYQQMADRIIEEAAGGEVVYAVPGHPLVGEQSVNLIIHKAKEAGIGVDIVSSPSFIEAMLEDLKVHMDEGLKILDALLIEDLTPSLDTPNIVYQVYDQDAASRTKLRLMEYFPDEWQVCLVRGAGTDTVEMIWLPLYELDRRECDHLTSVYVPRLVES